MCISRHAPEPHFADWSLSAQQVRAMHTRQRLPIPEPGTIGFPQSSELRFMVPRRLPILFVLCLACLWSCTVFTITFSCPPLFVFLAPFSWPNDPLALCCHIHVGIQFWRSLPYCLGRHPWHFLPCSLGPCLCLGIPLPSCFCGTRTWGGVQPCEHSWGQFGCGVGQSQAPPLPDPIEGLGRVGAACEPGECFLWSMPCSLVME